MEKNKFLGLLYDMLVRKEIVKQNDKPKDLKEKNERLERYLKKIERIHNKVLDNDQNLERVKQLYYDRYIIKDNDIPNHYFESLQKRYQDQGYGFINLVNPQSDKEKKIKNEHIEAIINEQKESLDNWLNYFLSNDSSYLKMWAKVWAFQGMLEIGNLNKYKDGYDRRNRTTVNPFVSFDPEILSKCVRLVEEIFSKKELNDEEVIKLVESGSFSKIYGKLLANKKQIKSEKTEGIWIKYNRETEDSIEEKIVKGQVPEYIRLYNSLQGYNTGWCTAGTKDIAKTQILGGDFYVYNSKNDEGNYIIPRIAIRLENNSIAEIRGIASEQNIESNMVEILEEKLKEFPDVESYKKKVKDMKKLTLIYNKHKEDDELTKEDLTFIYEVNSKINNFGYIKDPRIEEIIKDRNKRKDFAYIFDCSEDEIGLTKEEFDSGRKLKYYQGDLELQNLTVNGNLVLPEIINGSLKLRNLTNVTGLVLPQIINGSLYLSSLTSAKGLILPKTINGNLWLEGLTNAEDLLLPETLNGNLWLDSLTNAKGLILPRVLNGTLGLKKIASTEDLVLPEIINGNLNLNGLSSAEGLLLPQKINGDLNLNGLTNAKELILPQTINGSLWLNSLITAENLVLPDVINGSLNLKSLTNAKDLILPQTINGNLDLSCLRSAKGLVLPQIINGTINLSGLTSSEDLIIFQTITSGLNLRSLTNANGLILPEKIKGDLNLSGLNNIEGLVLPQTIYGTLWLNSLTSAEGLVLPQTINGNLNLSNLTSLIGIVLPKKVSMKIYIFGGIYSLEKIIEMQNQEEKQKSI